MSTNYPDGIDSYTEKTDGVDTASASHINDLQDAVEAIETELGTNPKGSFTNVADAILHKLNKTGDTLEGDLDFALNEAVNFKIERVSTLPTWTSDDEGRIIESNGKLYLGNSTEWVEFSQEPVLHNSLSDLQGGQTNEYYHLTSSQHTSATREANNSQNGLMPSGKMSNWDSAYTHKTTEDAVNGLIMCNGSGTYSGVTDNSSNWNTAYTNRVDTWTSPLQFSSNTASVQDATTSQKGAVQLQDSVDTTATKAATPNAVKACVGEDRRNITVILNATHPTYQVDVDFDILQVGQYNLTAGDLTIDVTVSGANGLDTGSEAPNTWYAVYVIYNPTTGTIAGLLSADTTPPSTANPPTLPSGYTVWRNVGWVRNDASSNFTLYCCISDGFCDRGDPSQPDYYDGGTTLYTNGGWYDLDLSAIIPPGAKSVLLSGYINDGTIGRTFRLRANTGSSNVRNVLEVRNQVAGAYAIAMGEVKLDSGRVIEYFFTSSTYNNYGLTICGWRF